MIYRIHFKIELAPSELLLPSEKKIGPERLNWPGRLAGISEFYKESRLVFTIIFKPKMVISRVKSLVHL
jgi:hypothetical protein